MGATSDLSNLLLRHGANDERVPETRELDDVKGRRELPDLIRPIVRSSNRPNDFSFLLFCAFESGTKRTRTRTRTRTRRRRKRSKRTWRAFSRPTGGVRAHSSCLPKVLLFRATWKELEGNNDRRRQFFVIFRGTIFNFWRY